MSKYVVNQFNVNSKTWESAMSNTKKIIVEMRITPEIACVMLERNKQNRDLSQNDVNKMVRDMKNNEWTFSNDAIAFDSEGNVLNGQHRLFAILESNTTQDFPVIYGMTKEEQMKMDGGKGRKLYDVAKIAGKNVRRFESAVGCYIRKTTIQYLPKRATRAEEISFLDNHKEALAWVNDMFYPSDLKNKDRAPVGKIGNDIASAFARAYAHYKKNDIEKIPRLELLGKALTYRSIYAELHTLDNAGDRGFFELISYKANHVKEQGGAGRIGRYRVAEKAILNFVNHETKALRVSQEELFPLPMELNARLEQKCKETELTKQVKEQTRELAVA